MRNKVIFLASTFRLILLDRNGGVLLKTVIKIMISRAMEAFKKRLASFRHAFRGVFHAARTEAHFRFHLLAALAVVIAGFYFQVSALEWLALLICIGLVLSAELINSAMERLVDYVSPEQSEMAKRVKDLSAAAVLVLSIFSAIVGLIIFINKL
ncbi:MAG: diacylglycerol kinase family protein [Bacteroidota bacterium]